MSALDPVILSEVSALSRAISEMAGGAGPVGVGMMAQLPSEAPVVTMGEQVFIRSGVVVPMYAYPDFPADVPQSAIGAVWAQVAVADSWQASGIAYGNGVFVIVYSMAAKVKVSEDDGKTWATYDIPGACSGVCFANGVFIAIRTGSNSNVYRSTDGKSWSSRTLQTTTDQVSIAYGNGKFVILSKSHATIHWSADGLTWATGTLPQMGYLSLAFGNGLFVAVGQARAVAYSVNGTTWTSASITTSASWTTASVTFGNGVFVAASGAAAEVATSIDGAVWVTSTSPAPASEICFAAGRFYLSTSNAQWSSITADKWVRNPQDVPRAGSSAVFADVGESTTAIVAVFNSQAAYVYRSADVIGAADYQQYLYLRVK
ncbi:hypothetical protein KAM385_07850 [Aeromonas hydrophila]|uniref:hypothetical protein n=1 Tax=Aeromonas hydrophila TaxID=644 RepID=UPI001CC40C79|nr:hypothetical protein [Aeromonas hydrophila]GJC03756.1 hypothetical protein KAM385_07850 [Aeromonas hydrophila]